MRVPISFSALLPASMRSAMPQGDPNPLAPSSGGSLGTDAFVRTRPAPPASMSVDQQAIFSRLTLTQQNQVLRIWSTATPQAQSALGKLLEDGRLVGSTDLRTGLSLLQHFFQIAVQSLPVGLDRQSLLSGLICQVQDPGLIHQGLRGTCTVTTAEYMLARRSPAEYARILADLSSPMGIVILANGKKARRVEDSIGQDNSGRSDASRLFESAMMAFANPVLTYSDKADKRGVGEYMFVSRGLMDLEIPRVLNALLDETYHVETAIPLLGNVPDSQIGHERLLKELKKALSRGQEVPAAIRWRAGPHEILILKIQNGRAYFRNPWGSSLSPGSETDGKDGPKRRIEAVGGIESIPVGELQSRLTQIIVH